MSDAPLEELPLESAEERRAREGFGRAWSRMLRVQALERGLSAEDRAAVANEAYRLLRPRRYALEDVERALDAHCLASVYAARPADVVRLLDGELPPSATIRRIALERTHPPSALGVLARALLGEHLATHGDTRAIDTALGGLRPELAALRERALAGDYTEAELRRLAAAGCPIGGEFAPGLPGVRPSARQALHERCRALFDAGALIGPPAPAPPAPAREQRRRPMRPRADARSGEGARADGANAEIACAGGADGR